MIRFARIDDIDAIIRIENEWPKYPRWGRNGWLNEFSKDFSKTLVYEENGCIVGFINWWENGDLIEINTLCVSKKHTRKNIASCLIDSVIENLGNFRRIVLEVNENNKPAINLYIKKGFSVYNRRKKYYDLKYDALLMELKI